MGFRKKDGGAWGLYVSGVMSGTGTYLSCRRRFKGKDTSGRRVEIGLVLLLLLFAGLRLSGSESFALSLVACVSRGFVSYRPQVS